MFRATNELPLDLLSSIKQGTLLNPKDGKKSSKVKNNPPIDMSDLAGAMDRIQSLSDQNESLMLENQRLHADCQHLRT